MMNVATRRERPALCLPERRGVVASLRRTAVPEPKVQDAIVEDELIAR